MCGYARVRLYVSPGVDCEIVSYSAGLVNLVGIQDHICFRPPLLGPDAGSMPILDSAVHGFG